MNCGWAIQGTFCDCSREIFEPPMTTPVSKKKVTYSVPVRSVEIMQREYDKFYNTDVSKANHKFTKDILKQTLLKILDEEKMIKVVVGDEPRRNLQISIQQRMRWRRYSWTHCFQHPKCSLHMTHRNTRCA